MVVGCWFVWNLLWKMVTSFTWAALFTVFGCHSRFTSDDIFKSQFYILPSTLTSVEKNINYFDEIKHIRGTDSYSLSQNSLSGKNVLMSHTVWLILDQWMYLWTSDKARIEQSNMRIEMINERDRKSKKRPIQHSDAEFSKAKIPNLVRGRQISSWLSNKLIPRRHHDTKKLLALHIDYLVEVLQIIYWKIHLISNEWTV